jgi:hypothetical protein
MKTKWCLALAVFAAMAINALAIAQGASGTAPPSMNPAPPPRPLLYFFEHLALREAAFRYDEDIQRLIANPRQAGEPMARLFGKAMLYAAKVPTFNQETAFADMTGFMRQIGFDTIQRGGYTIHMLRMPPPQYPPEAYFVAIVYKDGEPLVAGTPAPSTRYVTIEKTSVPGRAFALGEWDVNGNHKTHGFGNHEPTLQDLVANVFAMLGIDAAKQ